MLRARLLTSAIALPVAVLLGIVGGWPFVVAVTAVVAVASAEYFRAVRIATLGALIGVGLAAFQVLATRGSEAWAQAALIAAVAVPSLWPVLAGRPATALSDWSVVTLGVMYYGWLGSHAVLLRELPDGREWLFVGLFGVFATDTGAYFVGKTLGRHHLAPRISPHKTWEGAAGGFAGGLHRDPGVELSLRPSLSREGRLYCLDAWSPSSRNWEILRSRLSSALWQDRYHPLRHD